MEVNRKGEKIIFWLVMYLLSRETGIRKRNMRELGKGKEKSQGMTSVCLH